MNKDGITKLSTATVIFLILSALVSFVIIQDTLGIGKFVSMYAEYGVELPFLTTLYFRIGYVINFGIIFILAGFMLNECFRKKSMNFKKSIAIFFVLLVLLIVYRLAMLLPNFLLSGSISQY
ncbi:MAG: hypothetical protein NG737_04540 [Omnitrophica bacterium]|nr:hypothetical protein [Candidatus Omnitrophota bacterium]